MIIARKWQQAEGAAVFAASLVIYTQVDSPLAWWSALLIFFAPDLSFLAYLKDNRFGARVYNLCHLYGLGALIMALGYVIDASLVAAIGVLLLGHSGFDRMLGYGLKSEESFQSTHLGKIGKNT
ncbi:DUF4260 domain-containing protein [Cognatishimia maritima]|uniref:DUF4260 domain-containing protein n=1 Tax=Cognatishimia maritima TaxID=870908 RepID=A0A1M5UXP9_9RHOB|nr:DUF4260 domain-containing protein [Cognatishimia maritima]SHH67664.1 protein of unknown function [Cognatishimia maritima]